jgi:hypothetical protein
VVVILARFPAVVKPLSTRLFVIVYGLPVIVVMPPVSSPSNPTSGPETEAGPVVNEPPVVGETSVVAEAVPVVMNVEEIEFVTTATPGPGVVNRSSEMMMVRAEAPVAVVVTEKVF